MAKQEGFRGCKGEEHVTGGGGHRRYARWEHTDAFSRSLPTRGKRKATVARRYGVE